MLLSSSSRGGAAALRRGSSSTQQQAPVIGRSHRLSSKDNARAATSSSPSPLLLARRRPSPPRVATVVADAPPTTSTSAQPQPTDLQPIDWYKQWYPVAAVDDLLDDRPNAVRVLDLSLVAWRDGAGKWRVAADACPHRLAQLSEGRVEKREGGVKTLACPYHGWEFDGAGSCVRIPQLGDLGAPPTSADDTRPRPALSARRSCLTSYPSTVEQGLLWVWADPSTPQEEADKQAKCSLEDFRGEDADAELARRSTTAGWFVRDLPASFEATVENVVDPAHVNFTHSGVQGNRKAEKGTKLKLEEKVGASGFSFYHDVNRPGLPAGAPPPRVSVRFTAPSLVRYDFPFVGRSMCVYVIPTGVGKSRMLARFVRLGGKSDGGGKSAGSGSSKSDVDAPSSFASTAVDGKRKNDKAVEAAGGAAAAASSSTARPSGSGPAPPQKPSLMRKLLFAVLGAVEAQPVLEHALVRNKVLDGDNHLIHGQERQLAQWAEAQEKAAAALGNGDDDDADSAKTGLTLRSWKRGYWMPGEFDVGVQAWRSWLQGPGSRLPTWPQSAADLGPIVSRREALDRYEQHTKHCRHCSKALKDIDGKWLPGAALVAAACFAAAMWVAGVKAAAVLAAASAGGAGWGAAVAAGAREPVAWAFVAAGVVALLARRAAGWFRNELVFVDYVHAEKD